MFTCSQFTVTIWPYVATASFRNNDCSVLHSAGVNIRSPSENSLSTAALAGSVVVREMYCSLMCGTASKTTGQQDISQLQLWCQLLLNILSFICLKIPLISKKCNAVFLYILGSLVLQQRTLLWCMNYHFK